MNIKYGDRIMKDLFSTLDLSQKDKIYFLNGYKFLTFLTRNMSMLL